VLFVRSSPKIPFREKYLKICGGFSMPNPIAIQDVYPADVAHCYGCGRLNEHGLQIKTYWDGDTDETISFYVPRPYHTAIPGYVYGGLIASLIDCHGTGTAALAAYRAENRPPGSEPPLRFVTGSLQVDFHRPTPLGPRLELRGRAVEVKGRKVVVEVTLAADGEVCARGRVLCIQMPLSMLPGNTAAG
jgi:acyl-coenzyme A thioesterase PaaI-like protein